MYSVLPDCFSLWGQNTLLHWSWASENLYVTDEEQFFICSRLQDSTQSQLADLRTIITNLLAADSPNVQKSHGIEALGLLRPVTLLISSVTAARCEKHVSCHLYMKTSFWCWTKVVCKLFRRRWPTLWDLMTIQYLQHQAAETNWQLLETVSDLMLLVFFWQIQRALTFGYHVT